MGRWVGGWAERAPHKHYKHRREEQTLLPGNSPDCEHLRLQTAHTHRGVSCAGRKPSNWQHSSLCQLQSKGTNWSCPGKFTGLSQISPSDSSRLSLRGLVVWGTLGGGALGSGPKGSMEVTRHVWEDTQLKAWPRECCLAEEVPPTRFTVITESEEKVNLWEEDITVTHTYSAPHTALWAPFGVWSPEWSWE